MPMQCLKPIESIVCNMEVIVLKKIQSPLFNSHVIDCYPLSINNFSWNFSLTPWDLLVIFFFIGNFWTPIMWWFHVILLRVFKRRHSIGFEEKGPIEIRFVKRSEHREENALWEHTRLCSPLERLQKKLSFICHKDEWNLVTPITAQRHVCNIFTSIFFADFSAACWIRNKILTSIGISLETAEPISAARCGRPYTTHNFVLVPRDWELDPHEETSATLLTATALKNSRSLFYSLSSWNAVLLSVNLAHKEWSTFVVYDLHGTVENPMRTALMFDRAFPYCRK